MAATTLELADAIVDGSPPAYAPQVAEAAPWFPRMNEGGQRHIFHEAQAEVIIGVGPKASGKTDGFLNRIVRHCYENQNALALIIGITQRVASEGAGFDLVDRILPMWRDGNKEPLMLRDASGALRPNPRAGELTDNGIGLEFTQWTLDPVTKDRHLWIANRFGGWSKVLLVSIQRAAEVQRKLFGIQPSLVYIEELMNADGPEYYSVPLAQLGRRRGIVGPQVWMASLNTEAPDHWTYKLLYEDCVVKTGGRVWPNDPEKPSIMRDRKWAVYYIWFEENEHNIPPGYRERLLNAYRSDPIQRQRMLEAKWIAYPSGDALFKNEFSEAKHVFGKKEGARGLTPIKGYPILIGYDPGQVHTGIVLEQCIETAHGPFWIVFDDLCYNGERINYRRLTRGVLEKMAYWNRRMEYDFEFRHISDNSATTQWAPGKGSTTARDLLDFSKEYIEKEPERYGKLLPIRLIECPKPPGSVESRVEEVMNLLHDKMIAISATCTWVRNMFLHLVRDKESPMTPARGKYIHTFDALSYPVFYRRYVQTAGFRETLNSGPAVSVSVS